ncbi:hypothetical protein ASPACDRAFT_62995 [Aspergillus aculeatus ATCC 16872]|uniref:Transglycosylase SLT domain-containing protein n=1 Tax=Aspergillus aculeatus (strain ATCC 16872 / CBS 172.66 / WB 5094) TaxID=690307 RepID=A0A1L9WMD3_ASPA1|nr:uncharacterized protein ASPACDRAFT_62995 [Aspergillus aculeatus ATCC 16872]OJJ97327.1 hypothetical protein ASPACDRAFT_62995 [Aspergillus aculeatus ATCC 16872]
MKTFSLTSILLLSPLLIHAAPTGQGQLWTRDSTQITSEQIQTIAPTSNTCANAPAAGECATSDTAASSISKSFQTYGVTNKAEQAAVIGLMAFESGDFKYNKNHFPGVAGQGTRNMQSSAFNAKYAASIPALADSLKAVNGDPTGTLDLLRAVPEYDFGSGAWFLTTQCTASVRGQLQQGTQAGWEAFITGCVGTAANDDRKAYWSRAVEALGV